jgi:hypothetical protein
MKGKKKRFIAWLILPHTCWNNIMLNHIIAKFFSYFCLCRIQE